MLSANFYDRSERHCPPPSPRTHTFMPHTEIGMARMPPHRNGLTAPRAHGTSLCQAQRQNDQMCRKTCTLEIVDYAMHIHTSNRYYYYFYYTFLLWTNRVATNPTIAVHCHIRIIPFVPYGGDDADLGDICPLPSAAYTHWFASRDVQTSRTMRTANHIAKYMYMFACTARNGTHLF